MGCRRLGTVGDEDEGGRVQLAAALASKKSLVRLGAADTSRGKA
jgi:hypothetical protein